MTELDRLHQEIVKLEVLVARHQGADREARWARHLPICMLEQRRKKLTRTANRPLAWAERREKVTLYAIEW